MKKNKRMISLEISEDLREKLRFEAFLKEQSLSEIIRYILELYFRKEEK